MATILVVDDELGFRQIVRIILKRAGYKLMLAENTKQAAQAIAQTQPDLIILDDNMPGQSGAAFCQQLKSTPATASIPVLMYSASHRMESPVFVASIGADGYLKKPSMPQEILQAVQACLETPPQQAGV